VPVLVGDTIHLCIIHGIMITIVLLDMAIITEAFTMVTMEDTDITMIIMVVVAIMEEEMYNMAKLITGQETIMLIPA